MKNNPGLDNLGLFVYYISTMNIDQVIALLNEIREKHGNLIVTLDDFYTPASRIVDTVAVETDGNSPCGPTVAVIRS